MKPAMERNKKGKTVEIKDEYPYVWLWFQAPTLAVGVGETEKPGQVLKATREQAENILTQHRVRPALPDEVEAKREKVEADPKAYFTDKKHTPPWADRWPKAAKKPTKPKKEEGK